MNEWEWKKGRMLRSQYKLWNKNENFIKVKHEFFSKWHISQNFGWIDKITYKNETKKFFLKCNKICFAFMKQQFFFHLYILQIYVQFFILTYSISWWENASENANWQMYWLLLVDANDFRVASSNWIHYSVCQWTVCQCKGRSVCARNVLRMICRWMLLSLLNVVSMKCYPLALSTIHMQYSHHLSLFISFLFYFSLSPLRIQSHSPSRR